MPWQRPERSDDADAAPFEYERATASRERRLAGRVDGMPGSSLAYSRVDDDARLANPEHLIGTTT
jgi:hypothetical protein